MPTTLDPATALVLIDLQHGINALPTAHPAEEIVARCARLADVFRTNDKLVVAAKVAFARDSGDVIKTRTEENIDVNSAPDYGELRTEMGLSDRDLVVTHARLEAFFGTELDLELRRRKVTGIPLAGISTSAVSHDVAAARHCLTGNQRSRPSHQRRALAQGHPSLPDSKTLQMHLRCNRRAHETLIGVANDVKTLLKPPVALCRG